MAEYLTKAGWQRDGDYWADPHPELDDPRVKANHQKIHEAVKLQLSRDLV